MSKFLKLLDKPEHVKAYTDNRTKVLEAVEGQLVGDLTDPERRKRASLNNVAYAFQQVHQARRLESNLSTENTDIHVQYEAHVKKRQDAGTLADAIAARLAELGESI